MSSDDRFPKFTEESIMELQEFIVKSMENQGEIQIAKNFVTEGARDLFLEKAVLACGRCGFKSSEASRRDFKEDKHKMGRLFGGTINIRR